MSDPIGRMYARQVAALAAIAGPVVPPRPRVSEHTDAARLEATRDAIRTGTAPRPRVEGEAVRRPLDRTLVRLYAEFTDAECATHGDAGAVIRDLALNLLDADSSVVRLTAEVERLRGIALNLSAAWYYGGWKYETINEREMQSLMEQAGYWPTTEEQIIERRAALALPTHAPEATDARA